MADVSIFDNFIKVILLLCLMGLWNSRSSPENDPFKILESIEPEELNAFRSEFIERQQTCTHPNVIRFGPSYVSRPDGSYHRYDEYVCKDCLYSDTSSFGSGRN